MMYGSIGFSAKNSKIKGIAKTCFLCICFFYLPKVSFAQSLVVSSNTTLTAAQFLSYTSYTIQPGFTLTVTGAVSMNTAGFNISVVDNGALAFASSITSNNTGNLSVTGTGSMTIASGVTLNSSGSFTVGVNTTITGSVTLANSGSISNTASLTVSGSITLNSSGGLTNSSSISVGGNVLLSNSGSITDNGTMTVNGNFTIQSSGGISGSGSATVLGTASTVNTGTFFGSSNTCSGCTFFSPTFSSCAYAYKRLVRIDHTKVSGGSSLTNFPVFITTVGLADQAQFKSVANGGHVQNANGYDIYFTAADGITPLNFQYENYVATTGEFEAWVNIPSLSNTTDTYIYMYYGNSGVSSNLSSPNTWNSNYVGVWHLDENPGGSAPQYLDATSGNPENGTAYNMTASNSVTGIISKACYFNGSNNYVTFPVNSLPKNNAVQTISTWVNYVSTTGNNQNFVVLENSSSSSGQQMGFRGGTLLEWAWGGGTLVASPSVPTANAWHYCVYTYDGTTNSFYVDGVLKATSTTGPQTAFPTAVALGCYMSSSTTPGGEYFQGDLDEVHILTSALSTGWITTEYNNQSSPSTFAYISAEPVSWVGTTDGNWSTSANWSSGSVPASGANLIITNSTTNQPTVNANVQVGSLWVQSGATLTIGSGNSLSVSNDITNCGTILSASTGTLIMNGTSQANQNMAGTGTYNLGNLTINNSSTSPTVTLGSLVSVGGALTLTSGVVNTSLTSGTYIINMQNGSTAPALTSASTSYINGPMNYQLKSAATTTLNFPIGVGADCRPVALTVTHTSASNAYNYLGQAFAGNAFSVGTYTNYPATVDTLSGVHYWDISRYNSTGTVLQPSLELSGNQTIQLFFGADDGVYNGSLLTVCKTYTNSTDWVDIGSGACSIGTSSYTTAQAGSITSSSSGPTAFNSFSYFTLGRLLGTGKNSLPIELLSFSAIPDGQRVDVKWETVTETNNAYFTIEKSQDGITFTKWIDVPGAGNSTTNKEYFETDYQPYNGLSYYRLKQTDNNGNFTYFNMVAVNFKAQKNIFLFPNPIDNTTNLNVQIRGCVNEEVIVVLRDTQGKEFLSKVLLSELDNQLFIVDETKSLVPGVYIVTASTNDIIFNYKLIVK